MSYFIQWLAMFGGSILESGWQRIKCLFGRHCQIGFHPNCLSCKKPLAITEKQEN